VGDSCGSPSGNFQRGCGGGVWICRNGIVDVVGIERVFYHWVLVFLVFLS
jgi:hypothetical protein